MTTKLPPVPPANRSDKGPGAAPEARTEEAAKPERPENPDKQGQSANTKVNTTHQGMQQDR